MATLGELLDLSATLEERIAATKYASAREALEQRLAHVDFAAFGLFKTAGVADFSGFARNLSKPLAWGLGLGLPALGVGHLLLHDAKNQGKELIRDTRNQALLTAAGIGGMQGIGSAIGNALAQKPPTQREETEDFTGPNDQRMTNRRVIKLSALVTVDDALVAALPDMDAEACLYINRKHGTALLKELLLR